MSEQHVNTLLYMLLLCSVLCPKSKTTQHPIWLCIPLPLSLSALYTPSHHRRHCLIPCQSPATSNRSSSIWTLPGGTIREKHYHIPERKHHWQAMQKGTPHFPKHWLSVLGLAWDDVVKQRKDLSLEPWPLSCVCFLKMSIIQLASKCFFFKHFFPGFQELCGIKENHNLMWKHPLLPQVYWLPNII